MMQSVGKQGRFSKLTTTTFVCENGYAVGGGGGGGGGGVGWWGTSGWAFEFQPILPKCYIVFFSFFSLDRRP